MKNYKNKEWLKDKIIDKGMNYTEVAELGDAETDCKSIICYWMEKCDLKPNYKDEEWRI